MAKKYREDPDEGSESAAASPPAPEPEDNDRDAKDAVKAEKEPPKKKTFGIVSDHAFHVWLEGSKKIDILHGLNEVPMELYNHPVWGWHKCQKREL